jgi:nucleoid-associated protein YejK
LSDTQKIKIKRLAINALNLETSEPGISNELFPIKEGNKVINDFFQTHFTDTRGGKSTKSCKFIDSDATIKTKVNRFYSHQTDKEFLRLSKEITENLFKIMKNTSSNSSGTFFVIEVEFNGEDCIFIIKLDPKHGVQINYETLVVKVLENILPDTNDRVHKCAIIRNNIKEDERAELYVMDKQQKEGEPARFFLETFLQAEELLNDKIISKEVLRAAREKMYQITPEVPQSVVLSAIDQEFSSGSRVELKTSIKNILEKTVADDYEDRELFINKSADKFVESYLEKFPDHQTTFVVERKDAVVVYRSEKDQIYFRYNKGIRGQVNINDDPEGNTIVKIDKSLNFKQDLK